MIRNGLLALLLTAAIGTVSCQTLSGSGASGAEFTKSRELLRETRGRMDRAAQGSDLPAAWRALTEIRQQFDAIEAKTSSMNLMDNETMKIQIATGRRTITETDRWVQVNDADAVRSQVAQLDPILDQIDLLLDRAIKSSTPASGTP